MTKFFKFIGVTLGVIILIAAISIGLLITFVSPNKFKPIISAQVLKYTGRKLTMDGDLSWSFFPYLSLKAGHMILENPGGFSNKIFAEINDAKVGIKFMPLLHGKVETSGISISGLKVNLIKSALGTSNWVFAPAAPIVAAAELQSQHDKYTIPVDKNKEAQPQASSKKMTVDVVIPSIDVDNASVSWMDLQTKQTATIDHFELHAKNLNMNSPFDVKSAFDFNAKKPDASGNVKIAAQIQFNPDKGFYTVKDIDFASSINQPGKKFDVNLSGNILGNLKQQTVNFSQLKATIKNLPQIKSDITLTGEALVNFANDTLNLSNLTASMANLSVKGTANVSDISNKPLVKGHLVTTPFDLKAFLKAIGQDNPNLQTANKLTANVDFTANMDPELTKATPANPFAALNGVTLQGNVKMDTLRAANVTATNLNAVANLQNSVLNLSDISASLYSGSLKSQAKIVLNSKTPQVIFSGKLANIQAEPLLKDLGEQNSKIKVKGTANIDLQITTEGMDQAYLINHLNGTSHFGVVNGQLDGVNIGNLIDKAYATIRSQPAPTDPENVTNFGVLTGSATITNGVISNNDLYIDSPRFDTKGKGMIDLTKQRIDYLLETNMKNVASNHNDSNALNLYNIPIPIRISGNLSNPSTQLDLSTLAQSVAKLQLQRVQAQAQDKIKNQIQDKIKLKGKLGDQANKLINSFLGN